MQCRCKCLAPHMLTEQLLLLLPIASLPSHLVPTSGPTWPPNTWGTEHFFNDKQDREADQLKTSPPVSPPVLTDRKEEVREERYMKLLQLVLNYKSYPHSYRAQRKLSLHTAPLLQLHHWLKQLHRTPPIASLLTTMIHLIFPIGECFKYHKNYSHYDLIHI